MMPAHKPPKKEHTYEERSTKIAAMLQDQDFCLILRVDELHAEHDRFGTLKGNCYGYSEYWKFHLLPQDPEIVKALFPNNLPLNDDIIKFQRSKSAYITKELKNAGGFDAMIEIIATKYIMNNFVPGRMTEIVIATKPWTNDYHDVRMYCDKQGYMHWFDANAGWFRSKNPNPSVDSIIRFLTALFHVLPYNRMTSCCRHTSYIPKPYTESRRVTFVFDRQADEESKSKKSIIVAAPALEPAITEEEDSSSDESETEQLRRWVKNMRHS